MTLVLAFVALWLASLLIAARALARGTALERALLASVLVPAITLALIELLSLFAWLSRGPLTIATIASALLAAGLAGAPGRAQLAADLRAVGTGMRSLSTEPALLVAPLLACLALGIATLAAYLCVPWAWDALSYHLPVVYDALVEHRIREVPTHVFYANAYPHLVDLTYVAWRVLLADDTFVELGQVAFAPMGVLGVAAMAERCGVAPARAVALSCLWLATPVVALQLPSAYVDVAFASLVLAGYVFATARVTPAHLAAAALSLGLALGSKPSGPLVVGVGCLVVLARTARARRIGEGVLAVAGVLLVGGWKYLENLVVHGNPIWPIELRAGPIHLAGPSRMDEIANVGLQEPYASMGWGGRLLSSWTAAFPDSHVYDMRIGGFGPLFTFVLLPVALACGLLAWRIPRARTHLAPIGALVIVLSLATLATPAAYLPRYTVALVGVWLGLAISVAALLPARWRSGLELAAIVLAAIGLVRAVPGFTEWGPSLGAMWSMSPEERATVYGVDIEDERAFYDARALIREGEAGAHDRTFGLTARLWAPHGEGRIVYQPDPEPTPDWLVRFVDENRVRVIALGDPEVGHHASTTGAVAARARPDRFRALFPCTLEEACTVFEVLPPQ